MLAVLSLDSVSTELIDRLLSEGHLPNLARVTRQAPRVPLAEELPGAVYPALYTGRRLADHGIYFPLQWSASHQHTRPAGDLLAAELDRHSLFRRLAAHGLQVLVLDPPECGPHSVDHGVLASGVGFRARVLLPEWSRPESVGRELRKAQGRSPRADEIFGEPSLRYLLNAHRQLTQAPDLLARAAERLIARSDFDLVWITFAAAHQAGHVLWHPTFLKEKASAAQSKTLAGGLADVYRRIDEALGRVLACLPPNADVLILNSKAMGPNTCRAELLGALLDQILGQCRGQRQVQPSPLWRLRACLPQSFRGAAATALGDRLTYSLVGRAETLGRDWSRTRAFALPSEVQGFVRLNVRGRERQGTVSVGEMDALAQEIAEGLHTFNDIGGDADGAPAVRLVEPIATRVGLGENVERLPDLIVHWSNRPSAGISGLRSRRFGEVLRVGAGSGRAGNHGPGNWVSLVPGRARVASSLPAQGRLEDVAPTICAALGVPHSDLPGSALLEAQDFGRSSVSTLNLR